eukprot:TRINITY_DN8748_c0_g1_i1.p1 TRINITY_DN8748_c0_g1~~TRINITY_DN8748_c0_g1_i1.p1  ORF type:complete len:193 (+),score=72.28 TRINITY_DN8748_c0_g1_i1:68-646(+)
MSLSKIAYGWKFYVHMLNALPIPTKAFTAALLTYTGNVITQKVFEKQPRMNQARALKFVVFSLLLTPLSHYWYRFLDQAFPAEARKDKDGKKAGFDVSVIKKLAADELLYDPFCLLFFFTVIGLLERQGPGQIVERIKANYWTTQKMSWRVWPLVQLVNFAVVPGALRLPFINIVSFFWGIFLQLQASKKSA